MPEVAKQFGYSSATSTPFYRRTLAAKLFGMLAQTGAELTKRAKDYIRPENDGIKRLALVDAIMSIAYYAELVNKYDGKKLNSEYVSNGISTRFNLSPTCAMMCAKAFSESLRFAQMLSTDGVVLGTIKQEAITIPCVPSPAIVLPPVTTGNPAQEAPPPPGTHTHILPLDKDKRRKITVNAPLDLTHKEIERITKWLSITLPIDDDGSAGET